jgi:phosphotransferase system HPr-like phosphotransfer protein
MKLSVIKLIKDVNNAIESINLFVNTVKNYKYDIDVMSGRYIVDAKSIMGLFSLDLASDLTLRVHADECNDLIAELKQLGFIPEAD